MIVKVGEVNYKNVKIFLFEIVTNVLTALAMLFGFILLYFLFLGELFFTIPAYLLFFLIYKFGFSKIITKIHEKLHMEKALSYGYKTSLIFDKAKLKEISMNKIKKEIDENKKISIFNRHRYMLNGFCEFEEGVEFEPKHIQKVYLYPLKILLVIYFLILLGVLICLIYQRPIDLLIYIYLAAIISWKLNGCTNDIQGYLDLKNNEKQINRLFYENHNFYMELNKEEVESN